MDKIKVLLFAANPRGTPPLDLSREFREIDDEVGRGAFRDALELILVPGTRPVDLLHKLNENQPQVVHFSSHGSPDEIVLESEEEQTAASGQYGSSVRSPHQRDMKNADPQPIESAGISQGEGQAVSRSALVKVLRSCNEGNLRLVVLNACNTRPQAEALTEVVDCVVSMNRSVTDRAAIMFAASFYGALAFGRSIQRAFDQGVARLSAEGITESDTPELLVRPGVDASLLVLVGSAPTKAATPALEAPFIVPFPRNPEFVGRVGDLARLHAGLSSPGSGPVGIRPAGLTGMGGIGKTQLVVEYAYRHRGDYPEGIFWIDAAGPLVEGFARLATDHRLKWAENERPRDEQIRATFKALNCRPHALLVLDNLPDPAAIALHLLPDCVPEDLRCRLLFTTRRHDLGRFQGIEVTVLPEGPALRLLLRHPSRRGALDPSRADHEHARAIARMLGRLPLALELAGAYLGKYTGDVSLEDYREGLKTIGALATLDADAAELTEADLRRVHDPAVAATISEQWSSLPDESARLLLRVASLFSESAAVPIARLGLLAGFSDKAQPGRLSPLLRAVKRLDAACLVERLEADQVRLHPLIREFASGQTPQHQFDGFLGECLARAATALEHFPTLEALYVERGVDALQEDLITMLGLCPPSAPDLGARVEAMLRLLQREAHHLLAEDLRSNSTLFAQQVRNRAVHSGIASLQSSAEHRLVELAQPHFRLQWVASRESRDLIRTLTGHGDWVNAVALSPDGRRALSGSEDSMLRLWDLQTGQLLRTFAGHEAGVKAAVISPDGRHALSASGDGTLKLWGMESGQLIRTLVAHADGVSAVAMSRDGHHAVSGSRDTTLRLWDLQTGELLRTFAGHQGGITTLSVTPDGHRAVSGSHDSKLKIWDLMSGQLLHTLRGHKGVVRAVSLSPDGQHALSGSDDRTVTFWDLATGQPVRTFTGHEDDVNAVSVSPDGRHALSGSRDRTLRLWDIASGHLLRIFAGHEHAVSAVCVSPDGRQALSGSDDGTVKYWDLGSRYSSQISVGHDGPVSAVSVSPDGRHALSGSRDCTVRLWDLATGQLLRTFEGHERDVISVAISADGRHGLSGSVDRTVRLWDLQTGQLIRALTGHGDVVNAVLIGPDGRTALTGSSDRTLRLWDLQSGLELHELHREVQAPGVQGSQEVFTLLSHSHWTSAVAMTPDGCRALSSTYDHILKLWDLQTGDLIQSFVGHTEAICSVAVSSDNRHALSGSVDRTLRLWDLSTGQLLHSFSEHAGQVCTVAMCPDRRHGLSGSYDHTLRLWDFAHRICRATITLDSSPRTIALAPDGKSVVVGDRVGNVHHFQIHY
jgi:WD40 repeat protein